MATNSKGIYYRANTDANATSEAQALAVADSVPVGPNYIINGGFDIWQRGTSVTNCAQGVYLADRWAPNWYQTNRVSRVAVTAGLGPVSQYAIRSATRGDVSRSVVSTTLESVDSIPLRGKTVTLSFWMRSSAATWASTGSAYGAFRYYIGYITSTTDGSVGSTAYDSQTTATIANGSLPTSWTRYSITGTVPSNANNISVRFGMDTDGTAAADAYWYEVTDVQLEQGSTATAFRRNAASIAGELAACQRYYWRVAGNAAAGIYLGTGWSYNTSQGYITILYPNEMRTDPSSYDIGGAYDITDAANYGVGVSSMSAGMNRSSVILGVSASNAWLVSGRMLWLRLFNGGYFGVNAEL